MKKTVIYFSLGLFAFIVFTNLAVRKYAEDARKSADVPGIPGALEGVSKDDAGKMPGIPGKKVPDDPSKFGMIVMTPMNAPKDQGQWDKFMAKAFQDNKILETPEGKKAVEKMRINPRQYAESMERFEKESANVAALLEKNPTDPLLNTRKETLLKMKAVLEVLKQKGVVDPDAPDLPQFDERR